jgi:hypothetical protein
MRFRSVFLSLSLLGCALSPAAEEAPTRAQAWALLHPYDGPHKAGVNPSTLTGKVLCGYQGWFSAKGDGSGLDWRHYGARGRFEPGYCGIDLWPDLSDFSDGEKYPTAFRHANQQTAHVFSSENRDTVLRHFRWMEQYGIDGVFVQRFAVDTRQPLELRHCNLVLSHCREAANRAGRCYALMYDLSGLPAGGVERVLEDWKQLVDRMRLGKDTRDQAYLRHQGKPVIGVWGVGFNDGRRYTLEECARLVDFLQHDPTYGGFAVVLGVPTGWRTLDRDSTRDPALQRLIARADIVSPWSVGRYHLPVEVAKHGQERWQKDLEFCQGKRQEYLPVVFPGFSWHNVRPRAPLDQVPRHGGKFLWQQLVEAKKAGATMVYLAMFDEMNEGTAIFKCSNNPPVGKSRFVTYEGLPSDHYLWLAGMGGRLLRGEIGLTEDLPRRAAAKAAP